MRHRARPRAQIDATAGKDKLVARVTSGVKDLLVLKTTGSAFESFVRDEYTTLKEVRDRIFSTSIECWCEWARHRCAAEAPAGS